MTHLDATINHDQIQYMHTECSHSPSLPPNIIKHVPASIETRLSNLSSTEILFKESTTHYKDNLRQSGCNKKVKCKLTDTNHQKHSKHKRKIIWFNPPFSKNISTDIRKSLLGLLDLHFPKNHIYNSIFNRNKIKVSYNFMQNIKSNQLSYKQKIYSGTAKTDFKHRFNNHTKSFNLEHYENDKKLSKVY